MSKLPFHVKQAKRSATYAEVMVKVFQVTWGDAAGEGQWLRPSDGEVERNCR
jgi:hypothetical protein